MSAHQGKWIMAGLTLFIATWFVAPFVIRWASGYGEVDHQTYEIATALYAACNARSADRLSQVSQVIDQAKRDDQVPDREARWLERIIDRAESGDWESAARSARRMLSDQVTY